MKFIGDGSVKARELPTDCCMIMCTRLLLQTCIANGVYISKVEEEASQSSLKTI